MNLIDRHYINLMSSSLSCFAWSGDKANFRCPYCGDSKKSLTKKRGWFLTHTQNNITIFKCHNCGVSTSLTSFIKSFYPSLVNSYVVDKFSAVRTCLVEDNMEEKHKGEKVEKKLINNNEEWERICQLSKPIKGSPGEVYLLGRKIECFEKFRFVENAGLIISNEKDIGVTNHFVAGLGYMDNEGKAALKPRTAILIPMFTNDKRLYSIQFRFLQGNSRYLTIKLDNSIDYKVWGLESINTNKPIYVTEGVFDSCCLPNSIAMCGSSINYEILQEFKDNCIFILDNEKDNPQIVKRMREISDRGHKLIVWAKSKYKDINEYYINEGNVNMFLNKEPVTGLKAQFEINKWIKERNI